MRKRTWFLILSCLLLALLVLFFRWPRIDPGMVLVIQSRPRADTVEWQYRMRQPFELALCHQLKEQNTLPPTTGIVIGASTVVRTERVALFKARYDLLRGEYLVTIRLVNGDEFQVEVNGERVAIPLWSAKTGQAAEFVRVSPIGGDRVLLGDSVGDTIARIPAGEGRDETLVIYAGTEVEEWSR